MKSDKMNDGLGRSAKAIEARDKANQRIEETKAHTAKQIVRIDPNLCTVIDAKSAHIHKYN
jgi:hypothetical protein